MGQVSVTPLALRSTRENPASLRDDSAGQFSFEEARCGRCFRPNQADHLPHASWAGERGLALKFLVAAHQHSFPQAALPLAGTHPSPPEPRIMTALAVAFCFDGI